MLRITWEFKRRYGPLEDAFGEQWESEVFTKIAQIGNDLSLIEDYDSFVFVIARNSYVDARRKESRRKMYSLTQDPKDPASDLGNYTAEDKLTLNSALDRLNDKERLILYLSYYEGLSDNEVFSQYNHLLKYKSSASIRAVRRKAIIKIRKLIAE